MAIRIWWRELDSNQRGFHVGFTVRCLQPLGYLSEFGWQGRIRTCDTRINSPSLYRLSYPPVKRRDRWLGGWACLGRGAICRAVELILPQAIF